MNRKPTIGLIGGIGSGKSRVAAELVKYGARVINADQAGHEALRQPDIRARLVERWSPAILTETGEVDRRKVAAIVFADAAQRRALEEVVHPWIGRHLKQQVEAAQADPDVKFVVLDAAIMLEAGWNSVCDRLVYVDAPRDLRLARLARWRGLTTEEVDSRERAQLPLSVKAARADHAIDNSGSPEALAEQVRNLVKLWNLAS